MQEFIEGWASDRASTRIIKLPQYFLFGSGEVHNPVVVEISGDYGELHMTMVAMLYYYGPIPYAFFLYWLYRNMRRIDWRTFGVYLAIIIEGFTLANHRQPFFWILFALAAHEGCKRYEIQRSSPCL